MRADAARSRERILTAAAAAFERDGAAASLERIARDAGVGSATLHRHFRGRSALLEALVEDAIAHLAASADDSLRRFGARDALAAWLDDLVRHCAADAALIEALGGDPETVSRRWEPLDRAGGALVDAAVGAGTARADVRPRDLLRLVNALAASSPGDPDRAARLLELARRGYGVGG